MMKHAQRVWLCVPALLLYCCDVTITLASQRSEFWAGAFDTVEEGNPLARVLLLLGPWPFLLAAMGWAAVFVTVMLTGPRWLSLVASFGLTFSHALGTACWLPRHGIVGIAAAILLLVLAERILDWCWRRAGTDNSGSGVAIGCG